MKKQWIGVIVIGTALVVGYVANKISGAANSPIEQAAEFVLKTQGVDIDFSRKREGYFDDMD